MDDLISRQQAIDALNLAYTNTEVVNNRPVNDYERELYFRIRGKLSKLPSAQPQCKKGKWINHRKNYGHNIADCDQCGNAIQWFDGDEIPRYCCVCGADMRGESDE